MLRWVHLAYSRIDVTSGKWYGTVVFGISFESLHTVFVPSGQIFPSNRPRFGVRDLPSESRQGDQFERVNTWFTFVVAISLAGVQLYRATTAGSLGDNTVLRNVTIALILVGGVALYFTSYWNPVVYLLGAIFAGTLTVFWGLRAPVTMSLETSRLGLGLALFITCLYRFITEQFRTPPDKQRTSPDTSQNGG